MSGQLGSEDRPLRIAIIGSGPSGFYSAEHLLKSPLTIEVDMFDRLPAPYGLVRYGVAPDHAKIKNVIKVYEKIAEHPRFSFMGNVQVGKDINVNELKEFYDAIIICTGAETDRKLGIHGEGLPGSHTATEFVGWYNGHPDFRDRVFDLSHESAVIVGQGNVAMDVARILCKTIDELKETDICKHALEVLAESKVKEVHVIGRRGPMQAAFTPPEIKEFGELADCYPVIDPVELELREESIIEMNDPKNVVRKKNYDIMKSLVQIPANGRSRKFCLHFRKSPVEIEGAGRVQRLILEKNILEGEPDRQKARGTGEKEEIPCGILFRSVGYRGLPIAGLPFHDQWGIIPNHEGRVTDSEQIFTGLYVAGWIKRGPSGVIGTNKPDAQETVEHLLKDLDLLEPCRKPSRQALLELLAEREIRVISFEDWKKIDAAEIARGAKEGKPREKFVSVTGMLGAL